MRTIISSKKLSLSTLKKNKVIQKLCNQTTSIILRDFLSYSTKSFLIIQIYLLQSVSTHHNQESNSDSIVL